MDIGAFTLTDWLFISGGALTLLAVIAKLTPWKWDDRLVAASRKAWEAVKANKAGIESLASKRKGNGDKK